MRWLVAVQAQDYAAAKWALGIRLARATDETIERALTDGTILRTHALRWTWQFVSSSDIRWLLALVRSRLFSRTGKRHRELGLDATTFRKSNVVIERALGEGRHLTRDELGERLSKARISPAGQRIAHILGHSELDGLICSGARRGKQFTYALLDSRLPKVHKPLDRHEALAELARRYFESRGPATVSDFAWWSGLAPAEARDGLESVKSKLASVVVGGQTYFRADRAPARAAGGAAYLLPAFDEYLIAYRDRDSVLDPKVVKHINAGGGMLGPCVVIDGRVVGTWRRELTRTVVSVEVRTFVAPPPAHRRAIVAAARRYAAFLGLEADCRFL